MNADRLKGNSAYVLGEAPDVLLAYRAAVACDAGKERRVRSNPKGDEPSAGSSISRWQLDESSRRGKMCREPAGNRENEPRNTNEKELRSPRTGHCGKPSRESLVEQRVAPGRSISHRRPA